MDCFSVFAAQNMLAAHKIRMLGECLRNELYIQHRQVVGHNDEGLVHVRGDIGFIAVFPEHQLIIVAGEEVGNLVQGFSLSHLYVINNGTIFIEDGTIITPSEKIYDSIIAHIVKSDMKDFSVIVII